ncbi:hypothetical protein PR202_ga06796 [Eleusine coracana subsp. coracana]|uniref:Uncharacterized protein n=1 Tax=Eleusine coracana subsp. coracana TaxID=191504 RepID=A0AAV5BVS7_ELECO|nr:hypothetical protein PR202_ga06796 [Eleusine coracana subsp. coracana]
MARRRRARGKRCHRVVSYCCLTPGGRSYPAGHQQDADAVEVLLDSSARDGRSCRCVHRPLLSGVPGHSGRLGHAEDQMEVRLPMQDEARQRTRAGAAAGFHAAQEQQDELMQMSSTTR